MAKRPELMVMSGDLSGRRFEVPETGLRMGRASSMRKSPAAVRSRVSI